MTRYIQQLERELDVELLDRNVRPMRLTAAGEAYHQAALDFLAAVERIQERAATARKPATLLRIGTTHTIGSYILSQVAAFLRTKEATLAFRAEESSPADLLDKLKKKAIDVAAIPAHVIPEPIPGIEFVVICEAERVLITPLGHPLIGHTLKSLVDMAPFPMVLLTRRSPFSPHYVLEQEFRRNNTTLQISAEVAESDSVKHYGAAGLGISIVPRLILEPEDWRRLGVVSISHLVEGPSVVLAMATGAQLPLPQSLIVETFRRFFPNGSQ